MKSAIFISEDGPQIVLTPENAVDRAALDVAEALGVNGKTRISAFRGSAYSANGGWIRFVDNDRGDSDKSLIVRFMQERD